MTIVANLIIHLRCQIIWNLNRYGKLKMSKFRCILRYFAYDEVFERIVFWLLCRIPRAFWCSPETLSTLCEVSLRQRLQVERTDFWNIILVWMLLWMNKNSNCICTKLILIIFLNNFKIGPIISNILKNQRFKSRFS